MIQNIIKASKVVRFLLRNITFAPYTLWFNFHHLPFKQAIKLPIYILSRNKSLKKGKVIITSKECIPGMIKIGYKSYHQYSKGITYFNDGGTIEFQGPCFISNNSKLLIYKGGHLLIGDKVGISTSLIMCSSSIEICSGTMLGFDCTIIDSDFHPVIDIYARRVEKMSKPIVIGRNNWIGTGSLLLKGTQTPNNIIVKARSTLDTKYKIPEFSIIGMRPCTELLDEGYVSVFDKSFNHNSTNKLTEEEIKKILERKK